MKKLFVLIAFLCTMMISGCVSINSEIHIHSDLSGTWDVKVTSEVGPLQYRDLKDAMEKAELPKYEIYRVEDDNSLVKAQEGDRAVQWDIKGTFQNPQELGKLVRLMQENGTNGPVLKEEKGVVYVNLGRSLGKTTVVVDGDVITDSLKDGKLNGHTVTFEKNEAMVFQFKNSGWMWPYVIAIVIVLIIVGVGYFYFGKVKRHKQVPRA